MPQVVAPYKRSQLLTGGGCLLEALTGKIWCFGLAVVYGWSLHTTGART